VRLRHWMGIGEDVFYDPKRIAIVPMGGCFPGLDAKGGDLPPRRECAEEWRQKLLGALPDIELVLLIGQYAMRWHLGGEMAGGLTGTVAAALRVHAVQRLPRFLPLPHPSWRNSGWLKANPWFETDVLPLLRGEVKRLTGAE
jgi:uracil-DNA glycosylase